MSRYKAPSEAVYKAPATGSRVLVYCRFSGQDQDGASQESALHQWIGERGWTVYPGGWFLDEAKSGSSTEGRDGFKAMIKLAERLAKEQDRPAGVVCWKLDRFGRSFLDNLRYKAVLRGQGYSITSMADAVPEGSLAPLVEALLDTQAEAYLKEISANTKRGHALLRSMGYATGGRPPFGLIETREPMGQRKSGEVRLGTRWVADSATAPRVLQAFTMKAASATYVEMLRGPLQGVYRTKSALPPFFKRHGYVDGGVISQELYDRVQVVARRQARGEGADNAKAQVSRNLLTGLVFCGECGARMYAESQRRWRYFRCTERMRNPSAACRQQKMPADLVEGPLLDHIIGVIASPATFTADVNGQAPDDDGLQERAAHITRELAQVETSIARLLDALERDGIDGVRDRLKAREAERRRLRDDLQMVQDEIACQRRTVLTADEVAAIVDELRRTRELDDVAELRAIVAMLVQRVTITGREFQVEWRPEARPWFQP